MANNRRLVNGSVTTKRRKVGFSQNGERWEFPEKKKKTKVKKAK